MPYLGSAYFVLAIKSELAASRRPCFAMDSRTDEHFFSEWVFRFPFIFPLEEFGGQFLVGFVLYFLISLCFLCFGPVV